jgi:CRP-like cAMP-binding protein
MGISLAPPASSAVFVEKLDIGHASRGETLQDLLLSNPIFAGLNQEELQELEASARLRRYAPGDVLAHGADSIPSLIVVRSGAASALGDGKDVERLAPGAISAHMDTADDRIQYEALTVLEAYEVDGPALVSLLQGHPEIQNDLSGLTRNSSVTGSPAGKERRRSALLRTVHGFLGR